MRPPSGLFVKKSSAMLRKPRSGPKRLRSIYRQLDSRSKQKTEAEESNGHLSSACVAPGDRASHLEAHRALQPNDAQAASPDFADRHGMGELPPARVHRRRAALRNTGFGV